MAGFDKELRLFHQSMGLVVRVDVGRRFMARKQILRKLASGVAIAPDVGVEEAGSEFPSDSVGLVWRFYVIPWPMDTGWERVPIGPQGGKRVATGP